MSELIPPNYTPLERGLAAQTERITKTPVVVRELWNPWQCPADILPWLAWSLHVDDWDAARTEQQQRQAIADSIAIHQRKGTAAAVRRALQAIGYDVEIDEATGVPYTFRLVLDVSKGGIDEGDFERAIDATLENKNVRSHLVGVSALLRGTEAVFVAGAEASGEVTSILPPVRGWFETIKNFFLGGATHDIDSVTIFPPEPRDAEVSGPLYIAGHLDIELTYA